ncbi:MAG: hypothetical protein RIM72_11425 [Alphaproteobacteria bacterium]
MQSMDNFSKLQFYIDDLKAQAARHGVTVEICDDFRELQETVDAIEDRAPLTPIFDWRYSDIGADNGFWIRGADDKGQVIHLQAARIDTLSEMPLSDYLREKAPLFLSPHIPADIAHSTFDSCGWARESRGTVCYHGEIWIAPKGGFRARGLVKVLPRIVPPIAYRKWQPDYFYGMISARLVQRGLGAQYGYSHFHPLGIRWKLRDQDGTFDEYIAWMTPDDMTALMEATTDSHQLM